MASHRQRGSGDDVGADGFRVDAPVIALPKGGGAIRGIGEKFTANPVTGTGTLTVPIATSPGRSGFGPQLALSYDSGSGNGPFGFGWSLSVPGITRKTDKGLPQYRDAEESDVFVLSGAEDLVPVFRKNAAGWLRDPAGNLVVHDLPRVVDGVTYSVRRYRPRVEGLFALIERWTNTRKPEDCFWRAISSDNVTTWYGRDESSRIVDPSDPTRVFSWLMCESYDDKGSVMAYEFKAEDDANVDETRPHERNRRRRPGARGANRYLKNIRYGNRTPYVPRLLEDAPWPELPGAGQWLFEVVLDYGEHDQDRPTPQETGTWKPRTDPFSSYRAGFELRTYRLCQRALMFHHFPDEPDVRADCLVQSTDFTYSYEQDPDESRDPVFSFLRSVVQKGYRRQDDGYVSRSLPPVEFTYEEPVIDDTLHDVEAASLDNLPHGADGMQYQWVDLDGEGLSGLLTEQGGGWFYKRNLSPVHLETQDGVERARARLSPAVSVAAKPNASIASGEAQLLDLAGDGTLDLVLLDAPTPGFYEHGAPAEWLPFRPFLTRLSRTSRDPNVKLVDLDGDGHADVLISEDEAFTWHPSLAEDGFGPAEGVPKGRDEEDGPVVVFADGTQAIHLADMSGDGLSDLVRVRNGDVCYWPNIGYGRFGAKVAMDNAPWFDSPDLFDQRRLHLADIDGSGLTDIVYVRSDGVVQIYYNQSGNGWSQPRALAAFPSVDSVSDVAAVDLLGNGTACLVWSSPLLAAARRPMRYIDLMGGRKPHLLVAVRNNLGLEMTIQYEPSTRFYLEDELSGRPWVTRLPFPVHCVAKVTTYEKWRRARFATTYSYHHGYFDGVEREFRGFGRVDRLDAEAFDEFQDDNAGSPHVASERALYQPAVRTTTWFHTGANLGGEGIFRQFTSEYFPAWLDAQRPDDRDVLRTFREHDLPEPNLEAQDLTPEEYREALRACKGMPLRQEVCELDADALRLGEQRVVKVFSTGYHNCHVQRLQPRATNRHGIFLVTEREAITYEYELALGEDLQPPDPRVLHLLNLRVDDLGRVLQSASVTYGRRGRHVDATLPDGAEDRIAAAQTEPHLSYTETIYTNGVDEADDHRLGGLWEVKTFELTGVGATDLDAYFSIDGLRRLRLSVEYPPPDSVPSNDIVELEGIPYQQFPDGTAQMRLVEHQRTLYFDDTLTGALAPRTINRYGIPYERYKLALTESLINDVFEDKLDPGNPAGARARAILDTPAISGYLGGAELEQRFLGFETSGEYWIRSGTAGFSSGAAQPFMIPDLYTDPFGHTTRLVFDQRYVLFAESCEDARGNETSVDTFDYRVLAPRQLTDINGNVSQVSFDVLGMPAAFALLGKGADADSLAALDDTRIDPSPADVRGFFTGAYSESFPRDWLAGATGRHVYWFGDDIAADGSLRWGRYPAAACGIRRERHVADLAASGGGVSRLEVWVEHFDGLGGMMVTKGRAEPAVDDLTLRLRWIATGKTVLNNKGKPVKQYEPFFSRTEHRFDEDEAASAVGVTPVMYYDAPGRLVRTDLPDGSYRRVEFSPWHVTSHDANDTVGESGNAWFLSKSAAGASDGDRRAADLTTAHAATPSQVFLDSLGRDVVAVAHNRVTVIGANGQAAIQDEKYFSFTKLDAEGKALWIRDPLGNLVMQYIRPLKPTRAAGEIDPGGVETPPPDSVPCYDIAGNPLFQHSMDAADRWMLTDAARTPMLAWDVNSREAAGGGLVAERRVYRTEHDALHRPTAVWLRIDDGDEIQVERLEYRDTRNADGSANLRIAGDRAANLLGQLARHYDPSGRVEIVRRDFKGNVREETRTLNNQPLASLIDWSLLPDDSLEPEVFSQVTEFDALDRITRLFSWHRGEGSRVAVYLLEYNVRGLLARERLVTRARKTRDAGGRHDYREVPDVQLPRPVQGTRTHEAIREIRYDVKGQREYLALGNDTLTQYEYDAATFRLKQIRTTRPADDQDFPQRRSNLARTDTIQQLLFFHDAVGNVTEVEDQAYKPVFFDNAIAEPRNLYVYDPLYRLISATGRETAQGGDAAADGADPDLARGFPITDQTLRRYQEAYAYDPAGNFLSMRHAVPGDPAAGWTRHYECFPDSNRLRYTWRGNSRAGQVEHFYDAHGNMRNLERTGASQLLRWDHRDMMRTIDLGGGGTAYYQYDADKQRTRKRVVSRNGSGYWERISFGGFELYRRYGAGPESLETIESHHVFEGEQRVLQVDDVLETDRVDAAGTPRRALPVLRYQYSNHLGSACVEVDGGGAIISYEEYYPYGASCYRASRTDSSAPVKRYRYMRMERDEESGLAYHGARYYVYGLARWNSADPADITSGLNLYQFVGSSPLVMLDRSGRAERKFEPQGSGYRQRGIAINVDELKAVGEPDIPPAERMQRAKDLGERNFRIDLDNSYTKHNKTWVPGSGQVVAPEDLPKVSLKDKPGAIWRPQLSTVKEWNVFSREVEAAVKDRVKGVTNAGTVKEIINKQILESLKSGKSESAKIIRKTLEKQTGRKITDLFQPEFKTKVPWGKKFKMTKLGMIAAVTTAALASQQEANAAVPAPPPDEAPAQPAAASEPPATAPVQTPSAVAVLDALPKRGIAGEEKDIVDDQAKRSIPIIDRFSKTLEDLYTQASNALSGLVQSDDPAPAEPVKPVNKEQDWLRKSRLEASKPKDY